MIGIFDSGSGGLSVLREIIKLLPEESYVYYADNANCPYGAKSLPFIQDPSRAIPEFLLSRDHRGGMQHGHGGGGHDPEE